MNDQAMNSQPAAQPDTTSPDVPDVLPPVGAHSVVGMSVTRHYGPVSVCFTLQQEFPRHGTGVSSEIAAARWLYATIVAMAEDWERRNVATGLGQQPQVQAQTTAHSEVDVCVGKLYHEFSDGKHRWRFRGGRWTQYGVPVYKEVLDLLGFGDNSPLGEIPGDYRAEIALVDGKPKRVTRLGAAVEF